jgi:hypothetical protein
VISKTRVRTELDCWYQATPPVCSVLWLTGSGDDLAAAMTRLARALAPPHCQAASCRTGSQPPVLAGQPGFDLLLEGRLEFGGTAIDTSASPVVRHPASKASACEVASVRPEGQPRLWTLLAASRGLRLCAALFPGDTTPAENWIYSAARLVLVAGSSLLNRGSLTAEDAMLQAFLAATLQAGGIAVIKGALELCGPGFALTGADHHIDQAESAFGGAPGPDEQDEQDEQLVRHSLELAGPWSARAHRPYGYDPETARWTRAAPAPS